MDMECAARAERGLPTSHVLNMDEFPFKFVREDVRRFAEAAELWVSSEPTSVAAATNLLAARIALGDYAGVDEAAARLSPLNPTDVLGSLRLRAPPPPPAITLPKVKHPWPTKPSLFISADEVYFEVFGIPLLRSIAKHGSVPVHVHYLGDGLKAVAAARKIGVPLTCTVEDPSEFIAANSLKPKNYYNAIRFVRFAEALRQSSQTLFMMDIDSLAVAPPAKIFEVPGDVALRVRPGRLEPWNQFSACLVKGTPASAAYFSLVANIVHNSIKVPWWGLDQFALFAAYVQMRPDISLIGPDIAHVGDDVGGVVAFTGGAKKKSTLLTDQGGYAALYRSYR